MKTPQSHREPKPAGAGGQASLSRQTRETLRRIVDEVRGHMKMQAEWSSDRPGSGRGQTLLFDGPGGTGKTVAAEVLARDLQRPLHRVDPGAMVSKYIGETGENLARIFSAAQESGAVLFFDEADALFGRRTEVKDAHDRYANIEVSYLLERIEEHGGVVILATNRRENLDPAFLRRLRHVLTLSPDDSN